MAKGMIINTEIEKDPLIHRKIGRNPVNTDSVFAMTSETDYNVKGHFVNIEYPGLSQKICCKLYKKMPYFCQVLLDGETVTIPLSVARYINEQMGYEQHSYLTDPKGNPIKTGKKIPRGKFIIEEHLK
jgi:hypothetical protein